MDIETLSIAKKYTNDTVIGMGALKGDKGEKGDKGDTYLPKVGNVQTVDNEIDSSVTIDIDNLNKNAIFNFKLPKGKNGLNGSPGEKGEKGEKGDRGEQGLQGVQGLQGEKGDKGEQGEQGIQGVQGIQGERGADGYPFLIYKELQTLDDFIEEDYPEIGLMFLVKTWEENKGYPIYRYTRDGSETPYSLITYMNTEGIKGEKGDKGDKGEQGIQGIAGINGKDGITYTPEIGLVQTVESEAGASVTIDVVADTGRAIYNFDIPKGKDGVDGIVGKDGKNGIDGVDGFSPTINVTKTDEGHNVAITTIDGVSNFDIKDGIDGVDGKTNQVDLVTNTQYLNIVINKKGSNLFGWLKVKLTDVNEEIKLMINNSTVPVSYAPHPSVESITCTAPNVAELSICIKLKAVNNGTQSLFYPTDFCDVVTFGKNNNTYANTATKVRMDITNYTKVSELGLSEPCTALEICNVMKLLTQTDTTKPVNFQAFLQRSKYATDFPSNISYGELNIRASGAEGFEVLLTNANGGKVYAIYMGKPIAPAYNQPFESLTWHRVALMDDVPTVPTKVSQLTNDSGFITADEDKIGMGTIDGNEADTIPIGSDTDLTNLGFTKDVMTWKNGVYRCSHVTGLTNLPSVVCPSSTSSPNFRIEHYNLKKWNSNHNPYSSTHGIRYSVLYNSIGIFTRYTESGATAGTITSDTGWQRIQGGEHSITANNKSFKITLDRVNQYWYGGCKLISCGTDYIETDIYFTTNAIKYRCNRPGAIASITATVSNTDKKVEIGVNYVNTQYGMHEILYPNQLGYGTISEGAFTGNITATTDVIRDVNDGRVDMRQGSDSHIAGSIKYIVKDGICYGYLETTENFVNEAILGTLPKPKLGSARFPLTYYNTGTVPAHLYVASNGEVSMRIYTTAQPYGSFSYPVGV